MTTRIAIAALAALISISPIHAQDVQPEPAAARVTRGAVTNLPLPRFVSLKAVEGNVRRGPSLSHRVDWVYTRRDLPLKITAEYGHWRRVEDRDGQGGWVHYSLLSGVRTALVEVDEVSLLSQPDPRATVVARAERGVVARVEACQGAWCRIRKGRLQGWVERSTLWGVGPDEMIE